MPEAYNPEEFNVEAVLEGQRMTKEERYAQMIDYMNTVPDYNYHNGIKLIELADNYAACKVELTPETMNSQGMAHGGIIFAICDDAAGYAAAFIDRRLVTQGGNINFLRPATGSYLIAKAEPVKVGKNISIVESRAYDDQDRLVAHATFTLFYT
ncbi:MAG: PaaI family thioesterase [Clostridiales bacterium]|jgi:acyl-CoA thioesterase|nr:PaaI family thioesterase [Clostridiales bacterium]